MSPESFGKFAQKLRMKKGLGLRQAAKLMGLSPAYLSQVERDIDEPAKRMMAAMSQHYDCKLAEIQAAFRRAGLEHRKPRAQRPIEELYALYRLGGGTFTSTEVEDMIRHLLETRGEDSEEIKRVLAVLRADLPRSAQREGLFAADIEPRFLSKRGIADLAHRYLIKNGVGGDDYEPPTPIEQIAEHEDGISYLIDDLSLVAGDHEILGRTRWNGKEREITISRDLAESGRECDWHRFRFTLAHEFFHAIEHLRLPSSRLGQAVPTMMRVGFIERVNRKGLSRAERAVKRWTTGERGRGLLTREDWREWQANTFASAILMPDWALRSAFKERLGQESMWVAENRNAREVALEIAGGFLFSETVYEQSLAQVFDVSRQAMAIRLLELELVQEVSG